jgi:hypothetical protein
MVRCIIGWSRLDSSNRQDALQNYKVRARVLQTSLIDFTRFLANVPKSVLCKAAHVLLCRLSSIFVLKKETKHVIFGQSQNCPFLEIGMQYYFCIV